MIKGEPRKPEGVLSRELILSKVDDYNIYRHYLGEEIDFKKKYPSPFREGKTDTNPNLCFFPHDSGKILFKDFARGVGGDCFKFVEEKFNLNFYQVLEKIDDDFGLNLRSGGNSVFKIQLTKKPDSIHKQTKLIQIVARDFTNEELAYWDQYKITRYELDLKPVYSIDKLYVNKRLIPNYNKELRFAYQFDEYLKIYSPHSKDFKWISSTPNDFMSNMDNIKFRVYKGVQAEKLFISKSVKDEILLNKFFKDVCSTQNESSAAINEENMSYILKGYEPKDVYICYDNDEAGKEAADYYVTNYGFQALFTPQWTNVKDWGDLVSKHGLQVMEDYLRFNKLI